MIKLVQFPEIPPMVIKGEKTKAVAEGFTVEFQMDNNPKTNPKAAP